MLSSPSNGGALWVRLHHRCRRRNLRRPRVLASGCHSSANTWRASLRCRSPTKLCVAPSARSTPPPKGTSSFSDFQAAVATFAAGLPQQTVELCFSQLDADGDGRVSFRDFATMMSTLRPDGRAAGLVAPAAADLLELEERRGPRSLWLRCENLVFHSLINIDYT